jgi:hypothetical protein
MTPALKVTIIADLDWIPTKQEQKWEELPSGTHQFVMNCGTWARNACVELGFELEDALNAPQTFIGVARPDGEHVIGVELSFGSEHDIGHELEVATTLVGNNMVRQMSLYLGEHPLDSVVRLLLTHRGITRTIEITRSVEVNN